MKFTGLKEISRKGLAPRTYIDISGAQLLTNSKEPLAVGDRLLRQIRVGQYSDDVVRVVLTWPMIAPLMIFRYSPICIDWSSISSLNRPVRRLSQAPISRLSGQLQN